MEDPDASLEITGDRVWIFLPSSPELFTTLREGRGLKLVNTGLPAPPTGGPFLYTAIQRTLYLNDGTLLAQINFFGEGHATSNQIPGLATLAPLGIVGLRRLAQSGSLRLAVLPLRVATSFGIGPQVLCMGPHGEAAHSCIWTTRPSDQLVPIVC
jgi:hypothetical protein